MARLNSPEELQNFRQEILSKKDPNSPYVSICAGAGCVASGADEVLEAFHQEIEKQGLATTLDTKGTGCPGFCEQGPIVVIYPEETWYRYVDNEDIDEIINEHITHGRKVKRLLI